jgi:tetratricopeptide (TPR) repeat protein
MKNLIFVPLIVALCVAANFAQGRKAADIYNRGLELHNAGNLDAALAEYEKAIALFPRYIDAYNNRANIKLSRGDVAGAIDDYSKAIQIAPDSHLGYFNRGVVYMNSGDFDNAIADFTKSIEAMPVFAMAYNAAATRGAERKTSPVRWQITTRQ